MGSTQIDEPDPLDPGIIQRLDNRFSYRDIPEEYYTDEDGDEVCGFFLAIIQRVYREAEETRGLSLLPRPRF